MIASTAMKPITITYRIKLNENTTEVFDFELNGENFELISTTPESLPNWTELSFKQCSHCPLDEKEHSHCPMAVQLHQVIEKFHDTRSI
ncbi:MAG: hypothetical protein KDI30_08140, partial [Pseudomonadales bacterium]|nr:hypothetical protein [Pseudomonadales bacterium]